MKKQLLNESDIRKMMKFANIGALTDGFVTRLNETYMEEDLMEQDDEEGGEEDPMVGDDEMPAPEEDPMATPEEDPMPTDDVASEEGDEQAVLEAVGEAMEKFKEALRAAGPAGMAAADAISVQETGGDEGEETPPEDDLGGEEDLGMDMAGDALPPAAPEEDPLAEMEVVDEDEVMNEVARRVARRLKNLKRARRG